MQEQHMLLLTVRGTNPVVAQRDSMFEQLERGTSVSGSGPGRLRGGSVRAGVDGYPMHELSGTGEKMWRFSEIKKFKHKDLMIANFYTSLYMRDILCSLARRRDAA